VRSNQGRLPVSNRVDGFARAWYGREVPADGERPRRDAEHLRDRPGAASVRQGKPGRRHVAAAAGKRAALVERPALPRRLVLVAFAALWLAGSGTAGYNPPPAGPPTAR